MRHVYRCPLRWADLDLQGHVNNVSFADYLQEARIDLLRGQRRFGGQAAGTGTLRDGMVVVRHEIDYVAPLFFGLRPVNVEVWTTQRRAASCALAYEMYDEDSEGRRTTYLRATTVLTPFDFVENRPRRLTPSEAAGLDQFLDSPVARTARMVSMPATSQRFTSDQWVRFSDLDAYGHVNNVAYLEYFQEARIRFLQTLSSPEDQSQSWVIAHVDIDYVAPMGLRDQPYRVASWIEDFGRSSITVRADFEDPDTDRVLSRGRAVLVGFDPSVGAARPLSDSQRRRLADFRGPE